MAPNPSYDFSGQVALVTGAGSGIGREAARIFAARGARFYCTGHSEPGLVETKTLIAKEGGQAEVARADVSDEDDVAALLARIDKDTGRLDVAFNNAGIVGGAHRIEDYPAADFDNVVRVNLRSIFCA
jgi:NAD(P)-dependent dehydrogenase (short-subunit alcohol dehydrogenase family)